MFFSLKNYYCCIQIRKGQGLKKRLCPIYDASILHLEAMIVLTDLYLCDCVFKGLAILNSNNMCL